MNKMEHVLLLSDHVTRGIKFPDPRGTYYVNQECHVPVLVHVNPRQFARPIRVHHFVFCAMRVNDPIPIGIIDRQLALKGVSRNMIRRVVVVVGLNDVRERVVNSWAYLEASVVIRSYLLSLKNLFPVTTPVHWLGGGYLPTANGNGAPLKLLHAHWQAIFDNITVTSLKRLESAGFPPLIYFSNAFDGFTDMDLKDATGQLNYAGIAKLLPKLCKTIEFVC